MPRKNDVPTFRRFCGTSYRELDDKFFERLRGTARYYIYGRETCPDTGRLHWQWYMYLRDAKTENAMRKYIAPDHVEICGGTEEQNQRYCSKEREFIEWGIPPSQGARQDLDYARQMAANSNIEDVINYGSLQQIQVAEKWLSYFGAERDKSYPTEVIWIYGPSEHGKSKYAHTHWPNAYDKMPGKWWDGYKGELEVLMDDFDPNDYVPKELLKWWDRYKCRVEVKGGTRQLLAKKFIITHIDKPSDIWVGGMECKYHRQWLRRITTVINIEEVEQ